MEIWDTCSYFRHKNTTYHSYLLVINGIIDTCLDFLFPIDTEWNSR
jgi:hypothetical protein